MLEYINARQLRSNPKEIWDKLKRDHQLVITNNGQPTALMIDIQDENLEELLLTLKQMTAMRAVNQLRIDAAKSGASNLTMEEIDEEIQAVRRGKNR